MELMASLSNILNPTWRLFVSGRVVLKNDKETQCASDFDTILATRNALNLSEQVLFLMYAKMMQLWAKD